ncbi:hypothetical protein A4D02_27355 [Niastella koreensis]|uniref:GCN5-related N-acetyltransferase n=2 Tax=Niastella koreensis TaxID=354356 RepID=G8TGV8_NIAKG|nr:GNAT family N-acetyltransferase [Niastella koreensis]AEV99560.1 GCN5-related N-acetyltransferase [Niastella koreensis GR20-10]OQP50151.1 hypothetical protein A4D02_27355 [Niastella koreensis]
MDNAYLADSLQQATPSQLQQAAAYNHIELFALNARAQNGEVITNNGLTWTFNPGQKNGNVGFPELNSEDAGAQLDEMMHWYRAHAAVGVGCWSLSPSQPADLGVRLLARGFQPGWQPCWMALDLDTIITGYPKPGNLQVQADNNTNTSQVKDLPYAGDNGAVSDALMKRYPDRAQRFIARMDGEIVGHSCVLLTTGPYGVAGLYNVGVIPKARNKGVGKAVVTAACLFAKQQGYKYAILNGTGRRMYNQVGFEWVGDGLTWWLMADNYITHPPSPELISLAEAVGRGDINSINTLSRQVTAEQLNTPLANRMTLMQLATHCKQAAAAEHLATLGIPLGVLDAWDLGWKERAAALLAAEPDQVNARYGEHNATLLHIAAERNDVALAQLALTAHPDLSIKDSTWNAPALGWAYHMERLEIVALIKGYQSS